MVDISTPTVRGMTGTATYCRRMGFTRENPLPPRHSSLLGDDLVNNTSVHIGESHVTTTKAEGEFFVVDA